LEHKEEISVVASLVYGASGLTQRFVTSLGLNDERRRAFHLLLFPCMMMIGVGNSMLFAILPPIAREMRLPDVGVGAVFALSATCWVFISPYWGRVSDRRGRKPIIALGLAAFAVSMGCIALIAWAGLAGLLSAWATLIGLISARMIFGVVGSATMPAAQAYVADRTDPSERTDQIAALSAAFSLGAALGLGVCGMLAAALGPTSFIATCRNPARRSRRKRRTKRAIPGSWRWTRGWPAS
jgi:MFS family permease